MACCRRYDAEILKLSSSRDFNNANGSGSFLRHDRPETYDNSHRSQPSDDVQTLHDNSNSNLVNDMYAGIASWNRRSV